MTAVSASRAATAVLTVAVLFLLVTRSLFANSPLLIGAQVLAAILMLWARLTFGLRSFHGAANPTAGGVVSRGPYRWIRHPIYSAILLFVGAGVISHRSVVTVSAGLVAAAATSIRIMTEEHLLKARYPEYAEYAARTKRIIPYVL